MYHTNGTNERTNVQQGTRREKLTLCSTDFLSCVSLFSLFFFVFFFSDQMKDGIGKSTWRMCGGFSYSKYTRRERRRQQKNTSRTLTHRYIRVNETNPLKYVQSLSFGVCVRVSVFTLRIACYVGEFFHLYYTGEGKPFT